MFYAKRLSIDGKQQTVESTRLHFICHALFLNGFYWETQYVCKGFTESRVILTPQLIFISCLF